MEDKIDDIVIPTLQKIQLDFSAMRSDLSVLKESVRRIDSRIAAMDSHMAAFHSTLVHNNDEIDALRGRVEAIEETLDSEP